MRPVMVVGAVTVFFVAVVLVGLLVIPHLAMWMIGCLWGVTCG